jgi:hypothetical protein
MKLGCGPRMLRRLRLLRQQLLARLWAWLRLRDHESSSACIELLQAPY